MGDDDQGVIHSTSEGGVAGKHPPADKFQLVVAPSTANEFNTARLRLIPVACWKVEDIRFAFNSSFVSPDVAQELKILKDLREQHKQSDSAAGTTRYPALSVFGHADPVGPDAYNRALSGRRAKAIYALLISNTDPGSAVGLWQQIGNDENWGTDQRQTMQTATGLPDSMPDSNLYKAYMQTLCPPDLNLTQQDFLAQGADPKGKGDFQGCSSFNPLLLFSQKKENAFEQAQQNQDQAGIDARNAANAPNRRVVVLLFRVGSKVDPLKWPCSSVTGPMAACIKRFWSDGQNRRTTRRQNADREYDETQDTFACRFYDRICNNSPCEHVLASFSIGLFDHLGQPIPNALYRVTIGGKQMSEGTADAHGDLTLRHLAVPADCIMQWSRPLTAGGTTSYTAEDAFDVDGLDLEITTTPPASNTVTSLPSPDSGGFEYSRRVHIDVDGRFVTEAADDGQSGSSPREEAARRRLHNLGYSGALADSIRAFQKDCGSPESGLLDDAENEIIRRHDQSDLPSPGQLRTRA